MQHSASLPASSLVLCSYTFEECKTSIASFTQTTPSKSKRRCDKSRKDSANSRSYNTTFSPLGPYRPPLLKRAQRTLISRRPMKKKKTARKNAPEPPAPPPFNPKALSKKELEAAAAELQLIYKAEQEAAAATYIAQIEAKLEALANPAVLNAFAPEHSEGRYGSTCSDSDHGRGLDWDGDHNKDWSCKRCALLDLLELIMPDLSRDASRLDIFLEIRYDGRTFQ